ncbi:NAD(P)H-binding protein [Streptomyces sp. NPDC101118]|uniref:NAD(P)H-binding protein n=1 Tax=Streptomyces sp. NPDC101118 TaxID=3366109 RepID=UPI0037F33591
MTRSALLVGATGLVGHQLLARLLRDPLYDRVTVLARRPLDVAHPTLDVRVVDFDALEASDVPAVDDVYCALGSTIRAAGSQQAFRQVDQHYVVAVARLAHAAGARRIAVVSSVGAKAGARNFYLGVKGDMEEEVKTAGFERVEIFRPSFITGPRPDRRLAEKLGFAAASALSPAMRGSARAYRPVPAGRLAAAMIASLREGTGETPKGGASVRTYEDIVRLTEPA